MKKTLLVTMVFGLLALTAVPLMAQEDQGALAGSGALRRYEITITNLTHGPCAPFPPGPPNCQGQIFSSPVVAIHNSSAEPMYVLGAAPSDELALIAEDAVNQPMLDLLAADQNVYDSGVINGAHMVNLPQPIGPATLIFPGESATAIFEAGEGIGDYPFDGRTRYISLVGMAVQTNDAFFGMSGVKAPRGKGNSVEVYLNAYDAGSEANDESCTKIPGPPCGALFMRGTEGAEGRVSVHSGVHGIGDLAPEVRDWRNPVARVVIRVIE